MALCVAAVPAVQYLQAVAGQHRQLHRFMAPRPVLLAVGSSVMHLV